MRRAWLVALGMLCGLGWTMVATPRADAAPQFGQVLKRVQQFRDLQITEEEELELGAAVSEKIRLRYGVVQDPAVHKYVSLVGTVLALEGSRPNLQYQFIVLDTDGVNAFAAPGGFIHITRGALALIRNEAELAGVLAHELIHVTEKHTIKAIRKGKLIQMGADEKLSGNKALFDKVVEASTEVVLAGFGRDEEFAADQRALPIVNTVGYAPAGLPTFLERLSERNQNSSGKQGLFASHPEMKDRLDRIRKQIASGRLASTATVEARYRGTITYRPRPITDIAAVEEGAAGLTGGGKTAKEGEKPPEKKGRFGLGSLLKPSSSSEKKSAEVTGSAASRGVDTERGAKGGPVSKAVVVTLTAADIAAFKKEGSLQ